MKIEIDELVINKLNENDQIYLHEICNQDFVIKWMPDWEHDLDGINWLINHFIKGYSIKNPKKHPLCYAVRLIKTNQLIGICGFGTKEELNNNIEICYIINEKYSNKGYMGKVVEILVEFFFKTFEEKYLYALVDKENMSSYKILMKNNFKYIENSNIERINIPYYRCERRNIIKE
jgi:RimJ/RimL family protein N-acetyltransferase